MEAFSLVISLLALAVNVFVLVNLIRMNKHLENIEDCYIDVNYDTLMRDDNK